MCGVRKRKSDHSGNMIFQPHLISNNNKRERTRCVGFYGVNKAAVEQTKLKDKQDSEVGRCF